MIQIHDRGKWGKVIARGKMIFDLPALEYRCHHLIYQKVSPTTIRPILKWSPLILKAYNKYYRRKLRLAICLSKNNQSFVNYRYSIKICFLSHLHIREIHKFTIKYFFSVHAHGYHANLGEHGCLGAKWSEQSESNWAHSL